MTQTKKTCCRCNNNLDIKEFHRSASKAYNGVLPICNNCLEELYIHYCGLYEKVHTDYERKAMQRICMAFDIFYDNKIFESALKRQQSKNHNKFVIAYLKGTDLRQYNSKTYDNTIDNGEDNFEISDDDKIKPETIQRFGYGFEDSDYRFLQKEYDDWTTRHECNTKSQEEVFKNLCFDQLALYNARLNKVETKDLQATFNKDLEAANLQPKQNSKETLSDTQTFGTLIDKWENTRPLPEIDEDLKDVDKIGLYLDVFFKGHLSKMMGLKNGISNIYTKYIKKYTVEKPEYDNENEEAVFDALFGNQDEL